MADLTEPKRTGNPSNTQDVPAELPEQLQGKAMPLGISKARALLISSLVVLTQLVQARYLILLSRCLLLANQSGSLDDPIWCGY